MDTTSLVLGALAALAAAAAVVLAAKLKAARAALAEARARLAAPPPPPPPRVAESRREHHGLLWFPTLTVQDGDRTVLAAAAGVPHCARCVKPLAQSGGPSGDWACGSCPERRPATAADLQVTDAVIKETLGEFLSRHPGHRAAGALIRHLSVP